MRRTRLVDQRAPDLNRRMAHTTPSADSRQSVATSTPSG
jgi:hypothetical protein